MIRLFKDDSKSLKTPSAEKIRIPIIGFHWVIGSKLFSRGGVSLPWGKNIHCVGIHYHKLNSTVVYPTTLNIYCIHIRMSRGKYGQIYFFAWRSSKGQSLKELLNANEFIWLYIPSWVLIRPVYNFNYHYANDYLNNLIVNYCVYSLGNVLWNISLSCKF